MVNWRLVLKRIMHLFDWYFELYNNYITARKSVV